MNTISVNNVNKDSKPVNYSGCGHTVNVFITETTEHIKVEGHKGYWYIIERRYYKDKGAFYLCEHETYGDMTANIIIDENYKLILDDVWNGFDDLLEYWDGEEFKRNLFSVKDSILIFSKTADGFTTTMTNYTVVFMSMEYKVMLEQKVSSTSNTIDIFYKGGNAPVRKDVFEEKIKEYHLAKVKELCSTNQQ